MTRFNRSPRSPQQGLDVVVSRAVHPERLRPPLGRRREEQLLPVPERHHLVPDATNVIDYSTAVRDATLIANSLAVYKKTEDLFDS